MFISIERVFCSLLLHVVGYDFLCSSLQLLLDLECVSKLGLYLRVLGLLLQQLGLFGSNLLFKSSYHILGLKLN
jgi:hypothetical protein